MIGDAPTDASASRRAAAGARPDGVSNEREASRQVREMFSGIAPRYDFLNHFLSLSLDKVWRRRVAKYFGHVLANNNSRALDVCCGTGDLTLALLREGNGSVLGTDFAHPMLVRAAQKSAHVSAGGSHSGKLVGYFEADALSLPFADASFDLVTLAFGFRNLANYESGLKEFARILKPGGRLGILEFSEPRGAVFGPLYRWYFTHVLPRLGRIISGHSFAYSYLPSSVSKFPAPDALADLMRAAGFSDVSYELWTGGSVGFHRGTRK